MPRIRPATPALLLAVAVLVSVLGATGVAVIIHPPEKCARCALPAEQYRGRGILSARLAYGETTFGALTVSLPEAFSTDAEELSLFQEAARNMGARA